ncbi:MAG: ribonuclease E inhibitor RraB [Steroidobacteraceae bacterium]
MTWMIVLFVVAVAIIVARVYFNMRRLRQASSTESWDEKVIAGLRARGYAPFNPYPVDFFLALPDEAAVQGARARLESEGFGVDVKPLENDPELNFSLHATKTMRLIVPDMQELGRRLTALAAEHRGRYDGWAA